MPHHVVPLPRCHSCVTLVAQGKWGCWFSSMSWGIHWCSDLDVQLDLEDEFHLPWFSYEVLAHVLCSVIVSHCHIWLVLIWPPMSKSYEHACVAWNLNIPKFEIDLHAGSEPSQLIISFLGILSSIFNPDLDPIGFICLYLSFPSFFKTWICCSWSLVQTLVVQTLFYFWWPLLVVPKFSEHVKFSDGKSYFSVFCKMNVIDSTSANKNMHVYGRKANMLNMLFSRGTITSGQVNQNSGLNKINEIQFSAFNRKQNTTENMRFLGISQDEKSHI